MDVASKAMEDLSVVEKAPTGVSFMVAHRPFFAYAFYTLDHIEVGGGDAADDMEGVEEEDMSGRTLKKGVNVIFIG